MGDRKHKGFKLNKKGLDPSSATGARDRIDPETGVLGTGGGPVTTGNDKGVAGSTIGVGTQEGEDEYKSGDFKGATPGEQDYVHGRGSAAGAKPE